MLTKRSIESRKRSLKVKRSRIPPATPWALLVCSCSRIIKGRQRERSALNELGTASEAYTESDDSEHRFDLPCEAASFQTLPPDNRERIIQYYQGEKSDKIESRKKLIEQLGIPVNTLRMRALRLRERLQGCVEQCLSRA